MVERVKEDQNRTRRLAEVKKKSMCTHRPMETSYASSQGRKIFLPEGKEGIKWNLERETRQNKE